MNKILSKILVACGGLFLLISCNANNVSFSNDEGEIIAQNKDAFKGYSDFKRIDSDSKLLYEEGFDHVLESYEEVIEYKTLLEEKSETIYEEESEKTYVTYADMINYLDNLKPEQFIDKKLYISPEHSEAYYNRDSCRFEGMYKKSNVIYVHLYRDYLYKSMGFWVHQCYTFFLDKDETFSKVEFIIEDTFTY